MDASKTKYHSKSSEYPERRLATLRLNQEYPDRVPVVVWPMRELEEYEEGVGESRFLVARALTIGHFTLLLRELLDLGSPADSPLFIWCGDQLLGPLLSFRFIEEKFQEPDGFVYLYISDLGGSPEELKNLGTPAEKMQIKTVGQDRVVDLRPPELIHSLPRLRYPSPPQPDETIRTFGSTTFGRTPSEVSQVSAGGSSTVGGGHGVVAALPAPVLPPLRVGPEPSAVAGRRRAFRGPPRPAPPAGVTLQVPSPPASHMESCTSLFQEQAAARGAGPDISDEEDTGNALRLEELQLALGLKTVARPFFTTESTWLSQPKENTVHHDAPTTEPPLQSAEPAEEKIPMRVPAWVRDPKAAIQF